MTIITEIKVHRYSAAVLKMKIKFTKRKIEFEKELNSLDKFVIDFTSILIRLGIKYVIVSGYVSILFGRNRSSEDVDIIVENMAFARFQNLWKELYNGFECIITGSTKDAYNSYLLKEHAIRFARKGKFIPNIEFKFPKTELDIWTLRNKQEVLFNDRQIFISPLELQISFKLFLGTEKDIEDAKYLYKIFENNLNMQMLTKFNRKLNIGVLFNKYLK